MRKTAAAATLVLIAALIYIVQPGGNTRQAENTADQLPVPAPASQAQTAPDQETSSAPQTPETHSSHEPHAHDSIHDHEHPTDQSVKIPQEILDDLESKRIPASELKPVEHADGSVSLDLKGQFQHVPVAVIGEDGKVTIVEKVIQPIPDK